MLLIIPVLMFIQLDRFVSAKVTNEDTFIAEMAVARKSWLSHSDNALQLIKVNRAETVEDRSGRKRQIVYRVASTDCPKGKTSSKGGSCQVKTEVSALSSSRMLVNSILFSTT